MNLEALLAMTSPRQWRTRQAIVLDWNDGPRIGVCALAQPCCEFFFHLYAMPIKTDMLAIRLFALSELPQESVPQIAALLQHLGQPTAPMWAPAWKFPDDEVRRDVESRLDTFLVAARPTSLLTATDDWLSFDGCWSSERISSMCDATPMNS
jgi:hypothetical protein